ncbi:hypothetical protein JOE21_002743 [Desmospora profundinema]|uniref:Major facilitator superfamily (MFS) profile domain-containing protein n=1 Tax=Desmospora profundinema TaxID=1571184 RepID=A0ABU1IPS0_9BACL|nr:hypothetical protein [Desmospora profundinema]
MGRRKPLLVTAGILSFAGWFGLAFLPWSPGWSGILLYLLVGVSAAQMVVGFAAVKEFVPLRITGSALALVNAGVFLAVAVIQPLFGVLLDVAWDGTVVNGVPVYSLEDYRWGLLFSCLISFTGFLACFWVRETYCRNRPIESQSGARM